MQQFSGLPAHAITQSSIVTIGVFDGMHHGHQQFLRQLVAHAHAQNALAVVVTFDPHPDSVVHPERASGLLMPPAERIRLMAACGIDAVFSVAFNSDVQAMSAADFMQWVANATNITALWAGWDFALGRGREGTPERLAQIGSHSGFTVHTLPRIHADTLAPSSTAIRHALQAGEIGNVNSMLGRPFSYHGVVVKGDQRGRTIGFPTANLAIDQRLLLPKYGVYACIATFNGTQYPAVTNIGQRPTFNGVEPRIEAHLLDVTLDMYDAVMELALVEFIRPEQRFAGFAELVAQIKSDATTARTILLQ
jgi:riboflavin kinase/FMN adenylyltransferase